MIFQDLDSRAILLSQLKQQQQTNALASLHGSVSGMLFLFNIITIKMRTLLIHVCEVHIHVLIKCAFLSEVLSISLL